MASKEQHIDFSFRARYFTHGELTKGTHTIWFVIHGYGQLAKYFIRKFEALDPALNFVVAPEGTNRFYLEGFDGRVGATWMTRENRLTDIRNYITFLNSLYDIIMDKEHAPNVQVNVLGFSQGAATASRWVTDGHMRFNHLILWAGIFPPDLEVNTAQKSLHDKKISIVIGDKDQYITSQRIEEMERLGHELKVAPEIIQYGGGHAIDSKVLLTL